MVTMRRTDLVWFWLWMAVALPLIVVARIVGWWAFLGMPLVVWCQWKALKAANERDWRIRNGDAT